MKFSKFLSHAFIKYIYIYIKRKISHGCQACFKSLFARNAVEECVQFPLRATSKRFSGKILEEAFVFRSAELRTYENRSGDLRFRTHQSPMETLKSREFNYSRNFISISRSMSCHDINLLFPFFFYLDANFESISNSPSSNFDFLGF